jgi:N-acetylneuraminic acid mutarotase
MYDAQTQVWKELGKILKPRTKFTAIPISNKKILLIGGKHSDGQRAGDIEEYDVKKNRINPYKVSMPKPRSGFSAVFTNESK